MRIARSMAASVIVEVRVHVTSPAKESFHRERPIPERGGGVGRREHFLRTVKAEIHEVRGWTDFRQRVPAGMRNHECGAMAAQESQHLRIEAGPIAKFESKTSRAVVACVSEEFVDAFEIRFGRAKVSGKLQQDR